MWSMDSWPTDTHTIASAAMVSGVFRAGQHGKRASSESAAHVVEWAREEVPTFPTGW